MEAQALRLECVKQAAVVVASMTVENKAKATIDLASLLLEWIKQETK